MVDLPLLSVSDFTDYFRAVHGATPFPWQLRLVGSVVADRRWPTRLDLPTGSGKTAAIDIALFHLAIEAGRPDRAAPTRVVLVVDRRTIVDQAYERAQRIQGALARAEEGSVLARVRARLEGLGRPE
ncbi:MAG: DEAD/DEAH box helicase family protein, partial [Myxococcota bacterium]|nr:DEAD/DEAH box helicase family protein [Myxococcota bacterium]